MQQECLRRAFCRQLAWTELFLHTGFSRGWESKWCCLGNLAGHSEGRVGWGPSWLPGARLQMPGGEQLSGEKMRHGLDGGW